MRRARCTFLGLLAACAGGAAGAATFAVAPTSTPLRYRVADHTTVLIETPQGDQRSIDSATATIRLNIGEPTQGGRRVTAVFDALDVRSAGGMGSTRVTGGDLIGQEFSGVLAPTGRITLTQRPAIPRDVAEHTDPGNWLVDLLPPLPPTPNAASWPVESELSSETAMSMRLRYTGTARTAGDTTWNGQPATIIQFEGDFTLSGRGQPAGAPAELLMSISGSATRRWLWDATGGRMLAATGEFSGNGTIELVGMNFALPAAVTNRQTVLLVGN